MHCLSKTVFLGCLKSLYSWYFGWADIFLRDGTLIVLSSFDSELSSSCWRELLGVIFEIVWMIGAFKIVSGLAPAGTRARDVCWPVEPRHDNDDHGCSSDEYRQTHQYREQNDLSHLIPCQVAQNAPRMRASANAVFAICRIALMTSNWVPATHFVHTWKVIVPPVMSPTPSTFGCSRIESGSVSYTHLTLPTTPYV